jgi:alpha-D-ribose 1-methylphosphonate 5-triphosphate diphosphatase
MKTRQLLKGAQVVFPTEVGYGADILIEDGIISAINPQSAGTADIIQLEGLLLMPGMIDLHCDALEKEVEPRPNVHFPLAFACSQADKKNAIAGITTVFHAISFANHELGVRNNAFAAEIAEAVSKWQVHAMVENLVHARYEVTDDSAPPIINKLITCGHVRLLSFMNHTPGQGQFKDISSFRAYLAKAYKKSDTELDEIMSRKLLCAETALDRMRELAAVAKKYAVAIASHDDDSAEKIETISSLGVVISEFPVNITTAKTAKAKGLTTLFGAPNILRGKSQSGSVRALEAVMEGVADCLCGDYSPDALLTATLSLPELSDIGLPEAVALVTKNPARAAGFDDRGEIAVGKRADLIAVKKTGGLHHAKYVWCRGIPVFSRNLHRIGGIPQ